MNELHNFISKILDEKMVLENYGDYARAVTAAYEARPVFDSGAEGLWKQLAASNEKLFKQVQSRIDVEFVDDYEETGYTSSKEMKDRVAKEKKMIVDKRFSSHQVWTEEQNWKFRAVHDYVTHIGQGMPFSLRGELSAYNLHAKLVPPSVRPAIFSEVVGQVSYEIVTGSFPDPQKVCILYGFDYTSVGKIDWVEYRKNFESEEQMIELCTKYGVKEILESLTPTK